MRRREALLLYAGAVIVTATVVFVAQRTQAEPVGALAVACVTALACGAPVLVLLRPLLLQADRDATAAALLAGSTLGLMGPILALVARPTVRDAFTPAHLTLTLGSLLGLAIAIPFVVRAWREVQEPEWRPIALAALVIGAVSLIDPEVWAPVAITLVHVLAFVRSARLAWARDAIVLPAA